LEIDSPDVLAEVEAAFRRYETALVTNDIETLDALFWADARTTRYGVSENLHGIDAIRSFRKARSPLGLARHLRETRITTYGHHMATAATLFYRDGAPGKVGRQMQTWMRAHEAWRVVAAHVSLIEEPKSTP
jgi:hypothetical protein